ncbi:MAG: hypothetical protein ACOCPN_03425 [Desulfonatronovibrionaceae bacterium]
MRALCWKHFILSLLFTMLLSAPGSVLAYGGGGGGGGGGTGGGGGGDLSLDEWDIIFIDPEPVNEFGIIEGTIDLNNLPEPKQLTPQEKRELGSAIANRNAEFWNNFAPPAIWTADKLAWAGKFAGWYIAFTPVGIGMKVALSGTRGAADGYAAAAERGDGTEASQTAFSGIMAIGVESIGLSPVKGIIVAEITSQAANNSMANKAPNPNIGQSIMDQSKVTHTPFGTPMLNPVYK